MPQLKRWVSAQGIAIFAPIDSSVRKIFHNGIVFRKSKISFFTATSGATFLESFVRLASVITDIHVLLQM